MKPYIIELLPHHQGWLVTITTPSGRGYDYYRPTLADAMSRVHTFMADGYQRPIDVPPPPMRVEVKGASAWWLVAGVLFYVAGLSMGISLHELLP